MEKVYACIDLKSFFASVECVERHLDPLDTNLVVADASRTDKTVCLAVTPSLKQYSLGGRARLYEVKQKVLQINRLRKQENNYRPFRGKSFLDSQLKQKIELELDYLIAPPQMKKYMEYSSNIYKIYLKYIAPEDLYVYSIDEVFMDLTPYLKTYKLTPQELVTKIIKDIYKSTNITATGGIGTNLYLAKIAMDIVAKKISPDEYGVRIAYLDEEKYRRILWDHQPLTDFWRVGGGIGKRLKQYNLLTMGDIARKSLEDENLLYKILGINAELLIDHAWGYEPVTLKDIKEYQPETNSLTKGQVLHTPYSYEMGRIIILEMIDSLALDLVNKKKITNLLTLTINYDISNLETDYDGEIVYDFYHRQVPKPSNGRIRLDFYSSSSSYLSKKILELYEKLANRKLTIRKITLGADNLKPEENLQNDFVYEQLSLLNNPNYELQKVKEETNKTDLELQRVILNIKGKYGKNSLIKAMDLQSGATTIERNMQVGGHKE